MLDFLYFLICCSPMFLVSKMGSFMVSIFTVGNLWPLPRCAISRMYGKSHTNVWEIENLKKLPNFHIKRQKCQNLQVIRPWNLVCRFILGSYKKYMREFWKFLFLADFWGVKFRKNPILPKIWPLTLWKSAKNQNFQNSRI